jgi:type IV pilus assembly protein PilA
MKGANAGFTLIELMIVVAVIGILAAIALPSYSDYTVRAKVTECVGYLSTCKTEFTEYVATTGGLPPEGHSCVACNCKVDMTTNCKDLTTVNNIIEMDVNDDAGVKDNCYLRLIATVSDGAVTNWAPQTTCQYSEVPANFRNPAN